MAPSPRSVFGCQRYRSPQQPRHSALQITPLPGSKPRLAGSPILLASIRLFGLKPLVRSARAPSRPGGAVSSVGLDPPRRGAASRPCAGPRRPPRRVRLRAVGKKGTAAARTTERERVGAALVIGVHPAHHGVSPPACAPGHLRGAAVLGDVE